MVKNKREVSASDMALLVGMAGAIAAVISGCGTTTGWQVQLGVNPISAAQDTKALNKKELDGKYTFETTARN